MIAYIKGELAEVNENGIVVESNMTGYAISVPSSVLSQLPAIGEQIKIHTYLHVREDAMLLYGFLTKEDLAIFKLLIMVNGIGPKAALGILSAISPDELRFAILSDDTKTISKAPGIGAKTASKLILELKDKVRMEDAFEIRLKHAEEAMHESKKEAQASIQNDAAAALVALGYSSTEALKAVRQVEITENTDVEDVLKKALKHISLF
ncbi:Holliday junction branch migration protein RuvA [[Clostridium] polysaccharolyticum]|uniref:Holliday junction branch migration complex subunit RuvA n=1 Tax=[Clostridium] polysaccharolyticum TaxID=29364 RepID=A0A1I0B486_9FIRM|nr:Holliday junction branch migration protein RuvA [[Clostridium] polysaccharolyticum]SET01295.1 Holliday junction DNA helicase subunit RuvA [[Clostridium] polysaccharolyticum]